MSKRRTTRSGQPRPLFKTAERAPRAGTEVATHAAPPTSSDRGARLIAVLGSAAVAFVLYLATLAPTVATGDSGELSTVAATLGIAHPPGYPTFTVLGHLFTLLPFGDSAFRVNLLSAVLDTAAVLVAATIAGRLIETLRRGGGSLEPGWLAWGAAAIGGLSLALSSAFWRYSLVAEVFALANFLALVLLLLMLEWSRRPSDRRLLWAAAFVGGLALTNQQTILFAAPALVILLGVGLQRFTSAPVAGRAGLRVPWAALGIAALLVIAGLLPYLYLPIAAAGGAPAVWGDPTTPGGFLAIVARSAYGTFSFTVRDTSGSVLEHLGLLAGYLVNAFTPVGVALAAVGSIWLALRRGSEAAALGLWFLMTGPIFLALANPPLTDPVTRGVLERFYLQPSLPVALVIAVGVWSVGSWAHRAGSIPPAIRRWAGAATVAVALVGLGTLAAIRLPDVDQSGNRVAEAYADDLLGSLPINSVLLMRSDENYTSVTYAQTIRAVRPDVVAIDVELLKLDSYVKLIGTRHPDVAIPFGHYDGGVRTHLADLIDGVIGERPVFVAGDLEEDLSSRFDVVDEGLADEIVPDGYAPDPLAALRDTPSLFDRLHPPDRVYPETSWEAAIAAHYADVAFKIGVALQELGPQSNAADVERFYRAAIRISPTLASAYKNLGLLLQKNGGPAAEIVPLWQRYLELVPDDPEASAIRAAIDRLGGGSPRP
jgi:dolichyl-phosphate-mannose-protein mannosyltransferase